MSINATQLAIRLTQAITADSAATGNPMSWMWPPLLRGLARGRPVAVEDLAQATGRSPAGVRDGLAVLADTEMTTRAGWSGTGSRCARPRTSSPSTANGSTPGVPWTP